MPDKPPDTGDQDPNHLTMQLVAEEIAVSRRRINTLVRVSRKTITTERQIQEDLSHEAVIVERIPVGRTVEAVPPVREEGGTTVFSVVEEEIVVTRRLVLKEEVRVTRVTNVGCHVETVALREQQACVTRTQVNPPDIHHNTSEDITRSSIMTEEIIVAVFDTEIHAEAAIRDLRAADIPETAITRHAGTAAATDTAAVSGYNPRPPAEERGFWSNLFGGEPEYDTAVYDRSMAHGSIVVTVRIAEHEHERIVEILESHEPIDIEERAAGYGLARPATMQNASAQTAAMPPRTATPGLHENTDALQLSEEQLSVGKRLVNRGGTRIRRYVVETPVEEQVTLRDEKVTVERRPVAGGRAVTDADFSDRTIEMTESAEEAVLSKTARVVEEIALRKQATDRVETVRDTVRRQEVEVEQVPGGTETRAPKI